MKLTTLNIITDESVGGADKQRGYYSSLVDNISRNGEMGIKYLLTSTSIFFAKVYLNYHLQDIMSSASIDVNDFTRYLHGKPTNFLTNLQYDVPTINPRDINACLSESLNMLKVLVNNIHHDKLIDVMQEPLANPFKSVLRTNGFLSQDDVNDILHVTSTGALFYKVYNDVVLGSKIFFLAKSETD